MVGRIRKKVVIIDEDHSVGMALHHLAEDSGLIGALFSDPSEALDFIDSEGADAALIDYKIRHMPMLEVATSLRGKGWLGEIILLVNEHRDISDHDRERLDIANTVEKWRSNELLPAIFQKFSEMTI